MAKMALCIAHTASKRACSFVRRVTLCVYQELRDNYPARDDFYELLDCVSGCLRMLKDTRAIDTMYFNIHLYDPNNYAMECHEIIESIDHTVLQILKHISEMKLRELDFTQAAELSVLRISYQSSHETSTSSI